MNNNNKLLTAAVVVLLAAMAVPAVTAQTNLPGGGTFVGPADVDTTYALTPMTGAVFTSINFVDTNSDGFLQNGEPVYLHRGATTKVVVGDVRLTAAFGKTGGTIVAGTDDDFDRNLAAPPAGALCFFDADTNGVYNLGDQVYVNMAADLLVSVNDIPVSGTGAFTQVTTGTAGYNSPLICTGAAPFTFTAANQPFFNADGDAGYSTMDTVYLDIGSVAGFAGIGDIRLTKLASKPAGVQLSATEQEVQYNFIAALGNPYTSLCFVDVNSNGAFNGGEPAYLQVAACGPDAVAAGDLRLIATSGFTGGTLVKGSDDDFARDTVLITTGAAGAGFGASAYCAFDGDGSGTYSGGDFVFINVGAACPAPVTINDIILTGPQAFTTVVSGNTNLNNGGVAFTLPALGAESVFDADGVGGATRTTGDFVYIDADASGTPSINDIRLTKVGSFAAGTTLKVGDVDVRYTLGNPLVAPFTTVCFIDTDGDGVQDNNEAAYLMVAACGSIVAGTVRLTTVGLNPGGTVVKGSDDDFSRVAAALPGGAVGCMAFYDANGNGAYDYQEQLYIDFAAACAAALTAQGTVSANDIQVTGSGAFSRVSGTSSGLNNPLLSFPFGFAVLSIYNADGNGAATAFTTGDVLYADLSCAVACDAAPSVGDVRFIGLNGLGAGQIGGQVGDPTPTPTGSVTPTATVTVTATPTASPTATTPVTATQTPTTPVTSTSSPTSPVTGSPTPTPDGDDDDATPGFEVIALVAALGAALLLVRRKL